MTEHESLGLSDEGTPNVVVKMGEEGTIKDPVENDYSEPDCGVDMPDRQRDEADRDSTADSIIKKLLKKQKSENRWSIFLISLTFGSMVFYFIDVGTDVYVIYLLSERSSKWWLALTIIFVLVPTLITNSFSLMWYFDDKKDSKINAPPLSKNDKLIRYGLHCIGLGPIIRYVEALLFSDKCRRQQIRKGKWEIRKLLNANTLPFKERYNFEKLTYYAERDSSLLSLIKSFGQSAPQLILQVYILVIRGYSITESKASAKADVWQVISITVSLLCFAWGFSSYQRNLRFSIEGVNILKKRGQIVMFLWKLGMIISRVFSLALFATHFKYWLVPILFGHWGVMTMWIIHQNTVFCSTKSGRPIYWKEYIYDITMGIVYISCYFNVKQGPTFYKYIAYYIIVFLENCVCISLWYHYSDSSVWYHKPAIALVFLSFVFGLVMMLVYYGFLHPTLPRIDVKHFLKTGSLSPTGELDSNEKTAEKQSLFCVSKDQANSEDNTTPLEPKIEQAIYTVEDDADASKLSETGL